MKQCRVIKPVSVVCGVGSTVCISDAQYELAKDYLEEMKGTANMAEPKETKKAKKK